MQRRTAVILGVVWLMILVGIAASTLTLALAGRSSDDAHWISNSQYQMLERYARLEEVRSTLEARYYQPVDDDKLIEGAIEGMLSALEDRYSFYYTPDEMTRQTSESAGIYQGVGMLLACNADGKIEILRVYADSPAERSGAQAGDLIVRVEGQAVRGENTQTFAEAVARMRGENGSELALDIERDGQKLSLTLTRGEVNISNISQTLLSDKIGYINIAQFTGDDATGFLSALQALRAEGARGLIIDLRNNPGGLLTDVVKIADALLPEGLIVYTETRDGSRENFYSDAECYDGPIVVLINGMSASASEILAAAVQDSGRGVLVGTTSYGKGIVQTVVTFPEDGAGMQYTSACYYTPSGRSIHGTGVTPDVLVEAGADDPHYQIEPDPARDRQLQAALDQMARLTAAEE